VSGQAQHTACWNDQMQLHRAQLCLVMGLCRRCRRPRAARTALRRCGLRRRGGLEPAGRAGHVQRLVRAAGVVGVDSPVQGGLRAGQIRERGALVQELPLQALVETLFLTGWPSSGSGPAHQRGQQARSRAALRSV
jgi:hypothetical protein